MHGNIINAVTLYHRPPLVSEAIDRLVEASALSQ